MVESDQKCLQSIQCMKFTIRKKNVENYEILKYATTILLNDV